MARSKSFGTFGLIAIFLGVLIIVPFFFRQSRTMEGFEACKVNTCPAGKICEATRVGANLVNTCK